MKVVLLITACAVCLIAHGPDSLLFEPNHGQFANGTDFVARTAGSAVHLRGDGALLVSREQRVRMLLKAARGSVAEGLDKLPGVSNYFVGNDPAEWRTNVPQYARVRYRGVYRGIDLVYYGNEGRLEYDFVLAPGADHRVIELAFEGADRVSTNASGDLLLQSGDHTIRQLKPHVYQWDKGRKVEIAGGYRITPAGGVQFALAKYDRARELVIDPVIQYATYVGRAGVDSAVGVAADASGNAYITGETTSALLSTPNVVQPERAGDQDVFVAKISPSGAVLFMTYLGGAKTDTGLAVAVDEAGNPYVCGVTYSTNFPAREGVYMESKGGPFDGFVAKLDPTGTKLLYATYLGGSNAEWPAAITVDAQGGAWVTGWTTSTDFPVRGAYQSGSAGGGEDVFVTRLAASGSSLTYSTMFGGNGRDLSTGIAVDASGAVYVTGGTTSTAFPLANAAQPRPGGMQDAFVFKLQPQTNTLEYSTFLGGSGNELAAKVGIDPSGAAYIAGYTTSTNFPVSLNPVQRSLGGATDLFVAKLGSSGLVEYASYLGGSGDDWAGGIAVDAAGTLYLSGWTNSQNFPTKNPVQAIHAGGTLSTQRFDGVVVRLSPAGDELLYSTFFGGKGEDKAYGIALDRSGNVLVTGNTTSDDLPSSGGGFTPGGTAVTDAFVARLSADAAVTALVVRPASLSFTVNVGNTTTAPQTIELSSTGAPIGFTTGSNVPWLRVGPESGTTTMRVTVTVDASSLQAGQHSGEITIQSAQRTARIPVTVTATQAPNIVGVSPSPVQRTDNDVTVSITGGGYAPAAAVEVNGNRVNTTYVDARNLRAVLPASLVRQQGVLSVVVVNPDARSNAYSLPVVSSAGPAIVGAGVEHAATRQSGAVAPGQMVVVRGSGFGGSTLVATSPADGKLPVVASETRVLFDGVPAPVLWVQEGQAAVVAPATIGARTSTQVAVEYQGQPSAAVNVPVTPAAPGLFTVDHSGAGQASAHNQDYSVNSASNPAEKTSIIVLYGTGEGMVTPFYGDGVIAPNADVPRPVLPVSVTIGGVVAEVLYAGSVPGQSLGLLQINAQVPAGAPSGNAVPVVVTVGSHSSSAGATVAIR